MFESVLSMTWDDVLFAHWATDPAVVADRLPDALAVDTRDGRAYLGVVAFEMSDIRPRGAPLGLSFPEVNLRTYVTTDEGNGVYFFTLDADDPLGVTVARTLFRLPYFRARMSVDRAGDRVRFRSRRTTDDGRDARFDAEYAPASEATPVDPGSLAGFLTERYRFYTAGRGGRLYHGDIQHAPWRIAEATATVHENDLFAVNGFETPEGEPLLHYSPSIDVTAGALGRTPRRQSRRA